MLLLSAAEIESVEYNPSSRLFTSLVLCEGYDFVEVVFAEGSASLEERVGADGSVTHRLSFAMHGTKSDDVETLRRLSREGVVAIVENFEGEKFLVGYSPEACAEYPLRLAEVRLEGGSRKEQRAITSIILSSLDGSLACHFED